MVAFGALVESYSSFPRVCVSQFEFLLGKAVPNFEMAKVDPLLAFLFSSLYICSMTLFFLNVFIVILNGALEEVKDHLDAVTDELDLADFMTLYLFQGISNIFGRKKRKKQRLYCENLPFEDECAYVENCLVEIDRRISILAEDALTAGRVRLKKARLRKSSSSQTKTPLVKDKTGTSKTERTSQYMDLPLEEASNDEEVSTSLSSENEDQIVSSTRAVQGISNPLYSNRLPTRTEMDNTDEAIDRPITSSAIYVEIEHQDTQM